MNEMEKMPCKACGEIALDGPGAVNSCLTVRGEEIGVEISGFSCPGCGQRYTADMEPWDVADAVYRVYRMRHGMVQPEDIRAFRLRMDMTQDDLAMLLGCSRITISRYENGALQEASHDNLLRTAMDPGSFRKMLGSSSIPETRQRELLTRFREEGVSAQASLEALLGSSSPSEFTGFIRPDAGKLVAAVLYFCRNGISRTKLNKLLFYADFLHYKEFGVSITGAKYAHLPYGPCLDEYQHILAMLIEGRKALGVEEIESSGREGEMIELLKSQVAPDLGVFSPSEMQVIGAVAHQLEDLGAETAQQEVARREGLEGNRQRSAHLVRVRSRPRPGDDRREVKNMSEVCFYCGSSRRLEDDHVRAKCKGGVTTVVACAACNRSKGSRSLSEWLHWLEKNDPYRWRRVLANQEDHRNRVSKIVHTIRRQSRAKA